ncbi:MAG: amidophosphoribosyltransferase [Candidatus Muirbacterium halophilum]|nr:amidophosphoribosyltransferase [Candidatus Muirbacterium halophilum]MCK9474930.1 amidophosphoribosyltransferase [Candidatus Muirbacterium halophilum]
MKDECGVFGICSDKEERIGNIVYFGIYALQHRGQESAGIAVSDKNNKISFYKNTGLVSEVFNQEILSKLQGISAIGHVRYSTSGGKFTIDNAQPLISSFKYGMVALAHNGNITNAAKLKKQLENSGAIFRSDSDSEVLLHLIAKNKSDDFIEALKQEAHKLEGAFSIIILYNNKIIAFKDKNSIRPLCIGKLGNRYAISSESCAFDMIDAVFIREINEGEIIVIEKDKIISEIYIKKSERKFCAFEHIYFSRPDSVFFEKSVHLSRKEMGRKLAEHFPVNADVVIPVPDSGISCALGYSEYSKIPYDKGIIRNHYIGRTFIQPIQELRNIKVKMKLNPIFHVINGKKIVLVDDSIVRGTTSKKLVSLLKNAGAAEVHLRISCPMIVKPCKLGIDTPSTEELIACRMNKNQIRDYLKADSIEFLELPYLKQCLGQKGYCYKCFTP